MMMVFPYTDANQSFSMPDVFFAKKNILVTGGAGFIGSHLCERLLRDNHRVVCVDNFATSHVRNIEGLLSNPDFQFLRLDINQPFDLETFTELAGFKLPFQGIQEVYHLACPMSIVNFNQFKAQTLLANSLGMYHVLELARKYRAKVEFASSSVVYGPRRDESPHVEETEEGIVNHLSERACYDEGKRFAETMCMTYRQVHELDVRMARIFRTYGPRMPLFDGQLIPDFVLSALDGKDLVIYEKGDFRTSLTYVTDIVDGLVRFMNALQAPEVVNFGSDVEMQISAVAKQIIDMTKSTSKIVSGDDLLFLTELPLPRILRAKDLGWLPLVRLEDGLRKTIEYVKANKLLLTMS